MWGGVYDKFDEIDFDSLPDKFVIKATHSSGANWIVTDKSQFDINKARTFFNKQLRINFAFCNGLELHYKNIVPKIIIEEFIETNDDYKVFCFAGKAHVIEYMTDRDTEVKSAIYDLDWNLLPVTRGKLQCDHLVQRPNRLEEMIYLAETLSAGFSHVRVDFYCLKDGGLKFGEMTFTPSSGVGAWNPDEYDKTFGDLIELPTDHKQSEAI